MPRRAICSAAQAPNAATPARNDDDAHVLFLSAWNEDPAY